MTNRPAPSTKTAPRVPRVHVVLAGVALGLAFGAAEGIDKWVSMVVGVPKPMGHEILWVAPAVFAVVYAIFALLIVAVLWAVERAGALARFDRERLAAIVDRLTPILLVGSLSVLGYRALFHIHFRTSWYAEWLLVAGLAFQTTTFLARRWGRAAPVLARLAPWGCLTVLLLAPGIAFARRSAEATFLATIPRSGEKAPNVLLVVLDTVRADHLGSYGYPRPTPNLDGFAAEGLQFDYAMATSSWTLPSHATMMTGLYSYEHRAEMTTGKRLDERFPTVAEAFARGGYATAAFVANREYCSGSMGFDRGFGHFDDVFWSADESVQMTQLARELPLGRLTRLVFTAARGSWKPAPEINREFLSWLPRRGDRPFFVWLNYMDAHDPYYAPPPYDMRYGTEPANGVGPWSHLEEAAAVRKGEPAPHTQRKIDAYDCAIAYLDAQVGEMLESLRRQGLLDDTIVAIVSDHGEAFGEHGLYGHQTTLHREQIHVPLLLRYPRAIAPGGRVASAVSLRDLPATLAGLAGVAGSFPGRRLDAPPDGTPALAELLQNQHHHKELAASRGDVVSITTDEWHAIFSADPAELYARDDSRERNDLGGAPALDALAEELRGRWPARPRP
jgi:arylsulfatase A-like enzyme